jgi:hypothetical protein
VPCWLDFMCQADNQPALNFDMLELRAEVGFRSVFVELLLRACTCML